MKQIDKIIKSQSEPKDLNVLWLDTSNPEEPILKEYDGGWKAVAGGGGSTGNAVSYDEQTLTSPQQMQARKNQGLYYTEGETVSSLIWDGVPSEDDIHVHNEEFGMDYHLHRASSVPIPPSKMLGATVSWMGDTTEHSATITQAVVDTYESQAAQGYYNDPSAGFTVVLDDSMEEPAMGITVSRGVWFLNAVADGLSVSTKSIVLAEPYTEETIHHIEPKYIKDMYYEEEGIKTINYDINGDRVGGYTKVSDEIIEASAVIGHKFTSYSSDNGNTEYTITEDMVIAADGTHPTRILYDASDPNSWAILIFPEDMEFESDSFSKGVWFMDMGTIVNPNHIESLEYEGVTVHQIPSKYIPSSGLDVFEIEFSALTPQQLGEAELPNYTYEQIENAVASGKLLVLTLKQEGMSENEVWGRYIGGQLSRMYNPNNDYGRPCIRIPAAYSYLNQTIQGKFNSTIVKDIVIYEDWSQGGDEPTLMITVEDSFTNQ